MADEEDDTLDGGWRTRVRRRGDAVIRDPGPWSASVISLLRHLEQAQIQWSPRPVDDGFDPDGNEVLTFVEGASPQPHPWTDDAVARIGAMVRELHDATTGFVPAEQAVWKNWWGRDLGDAGTGFGHGDLGPWNIMGVDGMPTGFIDWETAGPIDPVWELAQVAWLNAQLHDDDVAELAGLGSALDRVRQFALIVEGYGLGRNDRLGFVDKMIEFAVHSARAEAIEHAVTPETVDGVDADGYPFLWAIAWRTKSASWMLRHRTQLDRAIAPL